MSIEVRTEQVKVFAGKRAGENVVGDAEDNRDRANAESQRADGDEREAKMITDVAKGVPNVANGAFEVGVHRETVHPAQVTFRKCYGIVAAQGTLV